MKYSAKVTYWLKKAKTESDPVKAKEHKRKARSIYLEEETGKPHCVTHLKAECPECLAKKTPTKNPRKGYSVSTKQKGNEMAAKPKRGRKKTPDMLNNAFGEELAKVRSEYGMSQTEMSRMTGVRTQYISDLEHGKRSPWSHETILEVSKLFEEEDEIRLRLMAARAITVGQHTFSVKGLEPKRVRSLVKKLDALTN